MLPSYFDYIFVHQRQKARLKPEIIPKFLSTLSPNPTRKARPHLQLYRTDSSAIKRIHDLTIVVVVVVVHIHLPVIGQRQM